jgi:hypothetical protein
MKKYFYLVLQKPTLPMRIGREKPAYSLMTLRASLNSHQKIDGA